MKQYEVVVVGAGPAGLSAAVEAASRGAQVLLVDANLIAGGQLFKQIHKFFGSSMHRAGVRGIDIGAGLLDRCKELGVEVWVDSVVVGMQHERTMIIRRGRGDDMETEYVQAQCVVVATGASEKAIRFPGWTLPGVMGAGAVQTMINVNRVLPGQRVLVIGSGNVGLIVTYQLMQAGADVVGIVEGLPRVNGYAVHAAKVVRAGVPIYTAHTIVSAEAGPDERVCKATIAAVDNKWNIQKGTEKVIDCDTIAIAVGLKPLVGIPNMYACDMYFDGVQGGRVPSHNENMETTQDGIYVAGDTTGVEEANTAIEEGKLAGAAIAERLGYFPAAEAAAYKKEIWARLNGLREGPHGEARRNAKSRQIDRFSRMKGDA